MSAETATAATTWTVVTETRTRPVSSVPVTDTSGRRGSTRKRTESVSVWCTPTTRCAPVEPPVARTSSCRATTVTNYSTPDVATDPKWNRL